MGRISKRMREHVAHLFGNRCPLCSTPFLSFDVHHIKFVSIGGIDAEENLIPLCPSCHRNYGHNLSERFDSALMGQIRTQRLSLVSAEQNIRSLTFKSPSEAADLLLHEAVHDLILKFGRYHRFLLLSEKIAQNLQTRTPTNRVLKARLLVFGGEMALYSEQEHRYVSLVRECRLTLRQSKELASVLAGAELIAARLAGRTWACKDEQEYMERDCVCEAQLDSDIKNEWLFRRIAYYKKRGKYDKALELAATFDAALHDGKNFALKSNILSEVARIHLYTGHADRARQEFQEVLSNSVGEFHRRGILITSIFLARANLALHNYDEAAANFLFGSQCVDVASSNDKLALEEINFALEERLGPNWPCSQPNKSSIRNDS